jgi:hypothetical protein
MGLCRCDRSHRESQLGRIDHRRRRQSPRGDRRPCQDPALRCGENSRPGKVRHRLEDSGKAILWFHDTRLSSDLDCFLGQVLQTGQIELQNFLHSPWTRWAVFDRDARWNVRVRVFWQKYGRDASREPEADGGTRAAVWTRFQRPPNFSSPKSRISSGAVPTGTR